jgi:hypothetical protein
MGIHVSRGVEVKNYCRSRGSLPFSPPANLLEGGGEGRGPGWRRRRKAYAGEGGSVAKES